MRQQTKIKMFQHLKKRLNGWYVSCYVSQISQMDLQTNVNHDEDRYPHQLLLA